MAKGKKTGGRVKGNPNHITRELKAFWHQFFESKAYQDNAMERIAAGKAPHLEAYLLPKIYGKATEHHHLEGSLSVPISVIHKHVTLTKP